ncbi:hypothetical protein K9M42_02865 [Patescibacteria group bacterium]|nr:hypothetical protein [Patescibacteria group bacterium]
MKYYVESGSFKNIVDSTNAVKAIYKSIEKWTKNNCMKTIKLGEKVSVSQKGFVFNKEDNGIKSIQKILYIEETNIDKIYPDCCLLFDVKMLINNFGKNLK